MHSIISNTIDGNPKSFAAPTSEKSGQKIILLSIIKLTIGLFKIFSVNITNSLKKVFSKYTQLHLLNTYFKPMSKS